MSDVPEFRLYGDGNPEIEERIQPKLALRCWRDLKTTERETFLQELHNKGWIEPRSREVLAAVDYLNRNFLRELPGKRLHKLKPLSGIYGENEFDRMNAAYADFYEIVATSNKEELVLRLLSAFATMHISRWEHDAARKEMDAEKRNALVERAFEKFDRFANMLNYLFRQFSVNVQVTRSGFAPIQDTTIAEKIYVPVLGVLSDPKYARVSDDLGKMFADYRAGDFGEVITKAHSAVQRFLQIRSGDEGKNGKGELKELFRTAKKNGLVSATRFGEPLINVLESFFPSERATKSTAKPSLSEATPRDAMLMMDLVLVFLQHCLAA
ncbi:hypothetical protein [Rhizomicrobium electricum]|uniref:Uncharacterized protein n=1 Tax=Rhizomicrobium electricum TaxID=480070 RepID=A0ABP3P9U1_9PROT|nr:hypothetical protein [Rhizomicrobium electricum]NIJ48175.1 hypothetical protein [Rhizomicrobium electricum]